MAVKRRRSRNPKGKVGIPVQEAKSVTSETREENQKGEIDTAAHEGEFHVHET